jgi:hypothetical protein
MRHHHHRHHRHHRPHAVILIINDFSIQLIHNTEIHMATIVTVGHKVNLAVIYLDANGNPMLVTPTADSVAWTNSNPAAETLATNADGTATTTAIAAGLDTVSLTVIVGGVNFTATLDVEVDAAAQVLTSVQIGATVV